MSGDTTKVQHMSPGEVHLLRKADKLEARVAALEKSDAGQASKERQEEHRRTLFGAKAGELGIAQKVEKLWDFRAAVLKITWTLLSALLLGAGGLLVTMLVREAANKGG